MLKSYKRKDIRQCVQKKLKKIKKTLAKLSNMSYNDFLLNGII